MLINVKKCTFTKPKLVYLGFVISRDGLKMEPEKVQAIIDWPSPRNIFEVRIFHGLESFDRKFINNFSGICASLLRKLRRIDIHFNGQQRLEGTFSS